MKIDVDPSANSNPPYCPIYPMSTAELKALQEELIYLLKYQIHRFQQEYLIFHRKLDSLTTKMNAPKEQGGQTKDLLLAAISDSKLHSELCSLLDDIYAQLATLRMDYLPYEMQMHAAVKAISVGT
ncbi:hypothetical protein HDU78_002229 [Chytriomyces hyalinus]|nr:hypothetical protein HDU78_002229 [Chytriomyces hyalinus]